jgi:hypothetical protein
MSSPSPSVELALVHVRMGNSASHSLVEFALQMVVVT